MTAPESPNSERNEWPKITMVTPVRNSARYIEQTIQSVISQQYPNLEYFIQDGGSTDGTLDIVRKYESHLAGWTTEPDNGMYDALNRGFTRSSGEIMGWISATDLLHRGSLFVVGSVFRALPQVEWITGRPTGFNDEGMCVTVSRSLKRWTRVRFLAGANRYIQQESTFWRRILWERAGSHVDATSRDGSDFELWTRFFRYARIYPVDALIGGFRDHPGSLSLENLEKYRRIHDAIIAAEWKRTPWGPAFAAFQTISRAMSRIPVVKAIWRNTVSSAIVRFPGPDRPPVIRYRDNTWKI
ncbi:MAG: glycosyltransferase family 2 protein [Candidatus Acidiferrales bacterium]